MQTLSSLCSLWLVLDEPADGPKVIWIISEADFLVAALAGLCPLWLALDEPADGPKVIMIIS